MESVFQKNVAILLGIGSILFIIAAFLPVSRVYVESAAEKKMEIINSMKSIWNISMTLFALGGLVTAVALGLQSYGLRSIQFAVYSHVGVALVFLGSILWGWHIIERLISPEGFANGTNTPYLFLVYSVLTQIGLALIGVLLIKSAIPHWIGWMFIIGSASLLILMIIFRDMPPFVYYVLTLIAAFAIYFKA
jgi:hypothetical protein